MNRERLKRLAKFLRTVPSERFDMSCWGRVENGNLGTGTKLCLKKNMCGTSACALGWATQIPSFKAAGLKLVITDVVDGGEDGDGKPTFENFAEVRFGKEQFSMGAAREFFGIGQLECHYLFNPSTYDNDDISTNEVIDRINELVEYGVINSEMVDVVTNEMESWSHG